MQEPADLRDVADDLSGIDWSATELGPVAAWDIRLRTLAGLVMRECSPVCLFWGASGTMVFNNAWLQALGALQSETLGQPLSAVWENLLPVYSDALSFGTEPCRAKFAKSLTPMLWRQLTDRAGEFLSCLTVPDDEGSTLGLLVQSESALVSASEASANERTRSAFLLRLSDTLRRLEYPNDIQTAGTRVIGDALDADRASFTEIDLSLSRAWQVCEYQRDGNAPQETIVHNLSDFGPALRMLQKGVPLVFDDLVDPQDLPVDSAAAEILKYAKSRHRAQLTVPILRADMLVAVLTLQHVQPHEWTVREVAFAHEAAVRIWEAVERSRAELQLRLSEARHRALFASIDEGVCLFERLPLRPDGLRDYRYVSMNPAMQAMFGIPDITGQSMRDNFPNEVEDWYDVCDRVLDTGTPIRMVRESGPQGMVLEIFVTRVEGGSSTMLLAVMQDVTARVRGEQVLRESEARRAFLLQLTDAMQKLTDPVDIEGECCRLLADWLDVDRAYFVEIDEPSGMAHVARDFVRHGAPSLVGDHALAAFRWSVEILRRGECQVIPDTRTSPLVPDADRTASFALGIVSSMTAPLIKNGTLVGALSATAGEPREWTDAQVDLLREVSERVWSAIRRARAEAALRTSERQLREVLDGMGEAFGLMDNEFRIMTQNRVALTMDGRPLEEIVGRTHWDVYPGTEDSEIGRLYKRALAEQVPVSLEHRYEWPDGHGVTWLDMRAFPVREGLAVFWGDVTDRKQAEEALRRSELRLRLAQTAAGIATFDWEVGSRVVTWSPEALLMLGLRAGELGGTYEDWIGTIHPDDLPHATEQIEWALEDGELEAEWRVRRPDGSVISVLVRGAVERDEQNRPVRLFGAQVDVTDRVRSEQDTRILISDLSAQIDALRRRLDKDGK